jgi:hypothetical protein
MASGACVTPILSIDFHVPVQSCALSAYNTRTGTPFTHSLTLSLDQSINQSIMLPYKVLLPLVASWFLLASLAHGFARTGLVGAPFITITPRQSSSRIVSVSGSGLYASAEEEKTATSPNAAPVLNGKRVLPFKVLMAGLKGHQVASVYALLNKDYKRGYGEQNKKT